MFSSCHLGGIVKTETSYPASNVNLNWAHGIIQGTFIKVINEIAKLYGFLTHLIITLKVEMVLRLNELYVKVKVVKTGLSISSFLSNYTNISSNPVFMIFRICFKLVLTINDKLSLHFTISIYFSTTWHDNKCYLSHLLY